MKIAIAEKNHWSYSRFWIEYCEMHNIPYKCVNPYDSDIIMQIKDCDAFMWHHSHGNYRDLLFAKQLLTSLEQSSMVVFPNTRTGWHFDDKLGQKYLFESLCIPAPKAWAFYDKRSAYKWIEKTTFPKVFKLRGGAASSNVKLAYSSGDAKRYVRRAFGKGYPATNSKLAAKTEWVKFIKGEGGVKSLFKATKWFLLTLFPSLVKGRVMLPYQKGYAYFQEFIPNEGFDYRLEIVGDKAIAMVRMCRDGDFRASGGHNDRYDFHLIPEDVVKFAFDCYAKLGVQSVALDIIRHKETKELFLIEISYCYGLDDDEFEHGYWTKDGVHHQEPFNGVHWMIECVIEEVHSKL